MWACMHTGTWICMYMYVHVCSHMCMHTSMHACLCVHVYAYVFMITHTCACILYTYMFACACTWGLGVSVLVYTHIHSSISLVSDQQLKRLFWCWSEASCWCGSFEWYINQELGGPTSPSISEPGCQGGNPSLITWEAVCGYARSFDLEVLPILRNIFVFALGFSTYNMKVI